MEIVQANSDADWSDGRVLFEAHLRWANGELFEQTRVQFDLDELLASLDLEPYHLPEGCLLLAVDEGQSVGCVALRRTDHETAEIKRMFVLPAFRRKGIARRLLSAVLEQAVFAGYRRCCLDTANFMLPAQTLYRQFGFTGIPPYASSEIPPAYHAHWTFMQRLL